MPRALLITVRFHDGRYHGAGDWPPAPARLFQALVAGAAQGRSLAAADRALFLWLEALAPPLIVAPRSRVGTAVKTYVPNNDLDAVGGDPGRVAEIRAAKTIRPRLFDAAEAFVYAWSLDASAAERGQALVGIVGRLYQLGRGVDMAWARADLAEDEPEACVAQQGGVLYRPGRRGGAEGLLCPQAGSLASLEARFAATGKRFATIGKDRKARILFAQPPKPRFRSIRYNSPARRLLHEFREVGTGKLESDFVATRLSRTADLVTRIRDGAAERLKGPLDDRADLVERVVVGRDAAEADKALRLRILPLPSIGHGHADHAIRRVLVEIPPDCPLDPGDIAWAFSGLDLGGGHGPVLTLSEDQGMLRHYGAAESTARLWRSVTPLALPQAAARRRIDPARLREPDAWKTAPERLGEEQRAIGAVAQALRHAGVTAQPARIMVQREPFSGRGERAEAFAAGTRFAKERLWHAEIRFAEGVGGPLILGDGRYLGLGLMHPVREPRREVVSFALPPEVRIAPADRADLLRAVRRALMALARQGDGSVPPLFSGHAADGGPAASGQHRHVFLGAVARADGTRIERILVVAPWICDPSVARGREEARLFDAVVPRLETLRAGRLGVIALEASPAGAGVAGPARSWESATDYRPARHAGRGKEAAPALLQDVVAECRRRALPQPEAELLSLAAGPREGVSARLRLRFATAVRGPLLLGRDSHHGGGLFLPRG